MSIYEGSTNVVANYQTAEYGKFLQLTSTDFPAISVTRLHYPDDSQAFPENTGVAPVTSTDIYPKYAILSHITNPSDISTTVNVSGSNVFINLNALSSQVAQTNILLSNILSADNSIAYHTQAIDLNTYDTLTAVAAFNNNYLTSLPILTSVYVVNPIITNTVSISASQTIPVSGNMYVTNPVTALSATVLNPVTAISIKQTVTNWDVLSAAVNSSTYTTLPSNPANEITILNNTGGIIYIKNASKSIGLPIDNNTSFDIKLVGDTSEVAVLASSNNKTVYGTFIAYN